MQIENLTELHYCIQCKDIKTGDVGCFAYDQQIYESTGKFSAISPNFGCVFQFYTWAHEQGFSLHKSNFIMMRDE